MGAKPKVGTHPQVLIGGILPPGGGVVKRSARPVASAPGFLMATAV